jgi:hypothetical protein
MALGMGAQYGTEEGLRKAGWQEGSSALAGDLAGLAAGGFSARIPEATWRMAPGRFLRDQSGEIIIGPSVGWGSTLRDLIELKMPAKASAEQVRSIVAGAPREEVQYSNLGSLLERNPTVTKEQVLGHLEQNKLPLTEVLRTEEDTNPQFRRYTTPHGKDYQEFLLTMGGPEIVPHPNVPGAFAVKLPDGSYAPNLREIFGGGPVPYAGRAEAKAQGMPQALAAWKNKSGGYKSGHWEEPDVLAHTRFQEHADMEGNPLFLVDEFQSDWHQAGRKEGYRKNLSAENLKAVHPQGENYWEVQTADGQFITNVTDPNLTAEQAIAEATRRLANEPQRTSQSGAVPQAPFSKDWHEVMFKRMLTEAVNRGHDTLAWPKGKNVAERFNLRQAVERIDYDPAEERLYGFDARGNEVLRESVPEDKLGSYIGEELAGRLKEKIGEHYQPSAEDYSVTFDEDAGGYVVRSASDGDKVTEDPFDTERKAQEFVDWMVEGDRRETPLPSLRGEKLEIGGKGMEGFYDKMMADYANKVGKRYGSKVEERQLRGQVERPNQSTEVLDTAATLAQDRYGKNFYDLPQEIADALVNEAEQIFLSQPPQHVPGDTVHAIRITPAMKNAVKRGLPLFGSALPDVATATGKSIKKTTK